MHLKIWIFPTLVFLLYGCVSFKPEKIYYHTTKRYFVYGGHDRAVTLRNDSNQLVDSTNFEAFQSEFFNRGLHYPFSERSENDDLLKKSDYKRTQLYTGINDAILKNDFQLALFYCNVMHSNFPDIERYSDCSFLKGLTYEKMGKYDRAAEAYQNFYTYSGQKYSKRFRGYRDADVNDSIYLAERTYAYHYLKGIPDSLPENILRPLKPKFYYSGYQPGFVYNPEDFKKKTRYLSSFFISTSMSDDLAAGYQLSALLNKSINVNAMAYYSNHVHGFGLSVPLQLYQSESNRLGIKLCPFLRLDRIDRLKMEGQYQSMDINFLNGGCKISAACFIDQKIWLGSYYQYYYFNENHTYQVNTNQAALWNINEYDFSAYYNVLKHLSLKVGVKNLDFVAGLYLGGIELSYNFTNPGFILKTDLF